MMRRFLARVMYRSGKIIWNTETCVVLAKNPVLAAEYAVANVMKSFRIKRMASCSECRVLEVDGSNGAGVKIAVSKDGEIAYDVLPDGGVIHNKEE